MSTPTVPPGFVPMSPTASILDPLPEGTGQAATETTNLVILCTWASANPRHIVKYTTTYNSMFPHTRILLLQSRMSEMLWRPASWLRANLEPALAIIQAARAKADTKKDIDAHILLHVFSNGGVNTSIQLQRLLISQELPPLTPYAHIIDSAPSRGASGHMSAVRAIRDTLPPRPTWVRSIALPVIHLVVLWSMLLDHLGWTNILDVNWKELSGATGLFRARLGQRVVKRVYLYSKADAVVPWKDVHKHAEESATAGFEVQEIVFEETGHVNHAAEPGRKRYWDAVQDALDR